MWVQSLASLNGLRIQNWCKLQCRSQMWLCMWPFIAVAVWHRPASYSSDSTPSPGTSICHGCGPKKKKYNNIYNDVGNDFRYSAIFFSRSHYSWRFFFSPLLNPQGISCLPFNTQPFASDLEPTCTFVSLSDGKVSLNSNTEFYNKSFKIFAGWIKVARKCLYERKSVIYSGQHILKSYSIYFHLTHTNLLIILITKSIELPFSKYTQFILPKNLKPVTNFLHIFHISVKSDNVERVQEMPPQTHFNPTHIPSSPLTGGTKPALTTIPKAMNGNFTLQSSPQGNIFISFLLIS